MRKFLSLFFAVIAFVAVTNAQDFSPTIAPLYTGPNWGTILDTGITCTGGPNISVVRDDGTYENGYQAIVTGDSSSFVQKMVLPTGFSTITQICVVWTRTAAGTVNRVHDLIVYDTLGAAGAPGNLIARIIGVTSSNIAIYPLHTRHSFTVNIPVTMRAYYVGVRLNNNPTQQAYFSADENGTTQGPGYWRTTTTYPAVWEALPNATFANWKNFGVRLEGTAGGGGGLQISRCRNGLSIPIMDHQTARDSVQVVLGNGCNVADVNVRIDTLTHTWDADVSIYLQRGTIGSLIVDNVGGSGDNFIGTILNDSAATPIASGVAPFTGSFRPSNPLTPFNGAFTSGYWRLVVTDTAGGDSGLLKAWCLVITYTNCTGIQQTIEIPNYYSLGQNYPNPFNPVTNIKFSIPQSQDVKLVVFDILGREVATLVNEYKTSGVYQVDFDASHLASGVYFYSLQTPNFTQTKRMLLVK
jgi:subtilisin-like proprotein convertase family protein